MFRWSKIGAKHIGIVQSRLVTCHLHESTRMTIWSMRRNAWASRRFANRTTLPRAWKTMFASQPLHYDLYESQRVNKAAQ